MRRASMNHVYRLVWSDREGAYVAVAENVKARGKTCRLGRVGSAVALALLPHFALAGGVVVAPGSGATEVYIAPNGVPVVNINTANTAGLSHNKYTDYNVGTNGLVLNNGNSAQMSRQSQLAGQVMANLNLSTEASVILNEVVAPSRSQLLGYTEVLGGKADVIVANPYGITCNGCGFINSDRVTLTTGTPNILGSGALGGFTINQGDVLVTGSGLDGTAQSYLDIVARSIKVTAQINAKDLKIAVGSNNWDYATQTVTPNTPIGTAPDFAFDSTVFGGMYANRIVIRATEAGVGVRMLGEAAATADDFTINAAGQIDIRSKVSAERNLSLTSSNAGADSIVLTDASVSAQQDVVLTAASGGLTMAGGILVAGNNLTGVLGSLTDTANTTALTDNNKRHAVTDLSLTVTNAAGIDGTTWGAGSSLTANVGSLSIGSGGATIYSDATLAATAATGDLALNTAAVKSAGNMALTATTGAVITTAAAAQGVQTAGGNLTLSAGNGLNNAGTITADVGSVTLRIDGTATNSGVVHAAASLDIADKGSGATENVSNSGTLLADGTLTVKAAAFANSGNMQGTGGTTFSATSLTNSGLLIASNTSGQAGTFAVDTLDNSGTLQSAGSLSFNVASSLTNSNKLLASDALTLRGSDSAYSVSSTGTTQAGGLMDIKGQGGGRGVDISVGASGVLLGNSMDVNAGTLTIGDGGKVSTAGDMTLGLNSLSFGGSSARIVAATSGSGTGTLTLVNSFSNPGAIHSGNVLNFSAPSITNTGTGGISALGTLNLSATGGDLYNAGALYAGSQLNASASGTLTNASNGNTSVQGTIDSGGSIALNAATLLNNSNINASQNVTITAGTFRNETPGGDTRTWTGNLNEVTVETHYESKGYNGCGCVDQTEWWDYRKTWNVDQYYAGGTPLFKPQIIGGGTITIQNFSSGTNIGAIISGNTVNISGSGTFTNDDLALQRKDYTATWTHYIKYIAAGPAKYEDTAQKNYSESFTASTISSIGAGIYANSINASGFSLVNAGSPFAASPASTSATGATSISGSATTVSFSGLVITLPTNPNGFFVLSQNPQSRYLVETNPLFGVGSDYLGSDYMADRLGLNVDEIGLRLGDAAYESYLIRQQLIAQTGSNILNGYANEKSMLEGMYTSATKVAGSLGLTWGQPLTPDQVGNLKEDIVWMVETTVAGKKVLAPVVYLSAATKASVESGAVIAGTNVNMNLASVTNTGGTIAGKENLSITSKGDIANLSGTIKGGNVSLTSTEGGIKNETVTVGSGNDLLYQTTIGKTAGIDATGNLDLNAAKDITVKGGRVTAGGDASLAAGGNVTFDTVVDKEARTTRSTSGGGLSFKSETTTVTTEKNVGSELGVGGNVKIKSGGDTTIAGSKATVGGGMDVDAGGSLNVVARQDKVTTKTETQEAGLGVGGGIYGIEKTTTESFKGTNVGSSVSVGGNTNVKTGKDIVLQGSNLEIGGNADLNAKGSIKVLDGLDEERTKTRTETTTFLSMDSTNSSGSSSGSSAGTGIASASAATGTAANAGNSTELNLSKTTVTDSQKRSATSVASNLKVGGNLNAKAGESVTIQGSNIEAGGDVNVDAKKVDVLAGRNEQYEKTTSTTTKVGVFVDSEAEGSASANAKVTGMTANVKGGAEAGGSANSVATFGTRIETSENTSDKLTHTGSTIKSGGNLSIKAKEEAKFQGAQVEAGGDLTIKAKDITNLAAEDHDITTSKSTRQTTGIYIDASGEGSAKASVKSNPLGSSAKADAEVKGDVSAGLRYARDESSSEEGSTTNVVSSFKSGNNLTRTAEGTIRDQGTQLEAGGNIQQSATKLVEDAISDKQWSTSSSESHDGRLGVYAGAEAGAGANAQRGLAGNSAGANADAEAGAGIKAKYTFESEKEQSSSTKAVTSSYKAGGNISSKTTEETKLVGTKMEAGGDISLEAKTLDFQAARDTTQESRSNKSAEGELKVAIYGTKGVSASGSYGEESGSSATSTAVTGKLSSGGGIRIKTQGDARLEGTEIEAGKDVGVTSTSGNVKFEAAKNTATEHSEGFDVSAELKVSKKDAEGGASGGFSKRDASEVTNSAAKITSKSGAVNVSAGKDATFEGTEITSAGDTNIAAKGSVNLLEAKDVKQESAIGFSAETSLSKKSQSGGVNVTAKGVDKQSGSATKINAGGKVNVSGDTVVSQEAELSGSETKVTGKVQNLSKTSVDKGYELEFDAEAARSGGGSGKKKSGDGSSGSGKSQGSPADGSASGKTSSGSGSGGDAKRSGTTGKSDADGETKVEAGTGTEVKRAPGGKTGKVEVPKASATASNAPAITQKVALPPLPAGKSYEVKTAKGAPLPGWVKFDASTGTLSGTPPSGFTGALDIVVKVPQSDGGVKEVAVKFEAR